VHLAEPNLVGVTMVGRAHLEGLGSIEAVAAAKAEIYQFHGSSSIQRRLFNLDNAWTKTMYETLINKEKETALTFASDSTQCDVSFKINKMNLDSLEISGHIRGHKGVTQIPIFGKQNLENLMFAACSALAVGLTSKQIWSALPGCKTIWGRNQRLTHASGTEFLFDAYNANPDSQKALIENLKLLQLERPLVGIFGEMRELGAKSPQLHEELGSLVATAPFQTVFFVGKHAENFKSGFEKNTQHQFPKSRLFTFPEVNEQLIENLKSLMNNQPLITIKGSRGMELERILELLSIKSHT
jgi:UDP-N-acetylmuramoyl-tripeptide--D-alanyl-D-alanine ligase